LDVWATLWRKVEQLKSTDGDNFLTIKGNCLIC